MSDAATALRLPLVEGDRQPADVTNDICRHLESRPSGLWWIGMTLSASALALGVVAVAYLLKTGIGVWGLNRTVGGASTSRTSCSGSASATPAR